MEQSLSKIQSLIQFLNCGQDDKYRFDDIEFRTKRTDKLAHKIDEVNKKVTTVLEELLLQIQDKYAAIGKIWLCLSIWFGSSSVIYFITIII